MTRGRTTALIICLTPGERRTLRAWQRATTISVGRARQSAREPLQRIVGTMTRWFDPIIHYIRNHYTIGMPEGFNNKIKLIQRMAYGLRNEHKRCKRILAYCGKT